MHATYKTSRVPQSKLYTRFHLRLQMLFKNSQDNSWDKVTGPVGWQYSDDKSNDLDGVQIIPDIIN